MLKELGWLPGSFGDRVAFPVNEILKPLAHDPGVEDCFNLVFVISSYYKRRRRLRRAAGDNVQTEAFQEADVEYRMYLHCLWQVQSVRSRSNLLQDGERADSFVVELPSWALCP